MSPDKIRQQWVHDRPAFEAFAKHVGELLESAFFRLGIPCIVSARAKGVPNLMIKVLKKKYSEYEQVTDKAGVRVIAWYPNSIDTIDETIRSVFEVLKFEDKGSQLQSDQFNYAGKHYEVKLRELPGTPPDFLNKQCEIQLHTRAQNLWSDVAHDLTYKPSQPVPSDVKRTINRLVALVELFDEQIVKAQQELQSLPDFQEAQMLRQLEEQFYKFASRPYDRELSLVVLAALKPLFTPKQIDAYGDTIGNFANSNRDKLNGIYEMYADDPRCSPLLFQPEFLAIVERLDKDEFTLVEAWDRSLPHEYLSEVATVWGRDIDPE